MKKINYLLPLILLFLSSCTNSCCKLKYNCAPLSEDAKAWLPFDLGDSIAFRDTAGNRYKFIVIHKQFDGELIDEPCPRGFGGGCNCPDYCWREGNISFSNTSAKDSLDSYAMSVTEYISRDNEHKKVSSTLFLRIADFYFSLPYLDSLQYSDPNYFALKLGNYVYKDVYLFSKTTSVDSITRISKVYYTKKYGLVSFFDKKTSSQFYKE